MRRLFFSKLPLIQFLESRTLLAAPFGAPIPSLVGHSPVALCSGDFNSDGKKDLAVANYNDRSVTILLGKGNGQFRKAASLTTGNYPYSICTDDFNGDDIPDLAVANSLGNSITVMLGAGDGTFSTQSTLFTGINPKSLRAADFNGDGNADLVAACNSNSLVSVFLGKGNGTFYNRFDYTTGSRPMSVNIGDFNGDSKLDLVVANSATDSVSILLGNGNGGFQTRVDYSTGDFPCWTTVGDFNKDGKLDLAVANYSDNTVSVLLGKGNGTFQTQSKYATGVNPNSVCLADFNKDGRLDLAVANYSNNTLSVLYGNFNGTFQKQIVCAAGNGPCGVIAEDFNNDNAPDLAVAGWTDNVANVMLNITGTGTNKAPTNLTLSKTTVMEKLPIGTIVGTFSATDPNANDTFTYKLVSGTGSTDNASFTLIGKTLKTAAVFDFAQKKSYSIRVRVTDKGGLSYEKTLTINVLTKGAVAGTVFLDFNRNKVKDLSETGLKNWRVFADLDNDTVWDSNEPSVLTNVQGNYTLKLDPGSYQIRLVKQTGFAFTTPPKGTFSLTVISAQTLSGKHFGMSK